MMLPKGKVWGRKEPKVNLEKQEEPDDEEPGLHTKGEQSHEIILAEEWQKISISEKSL